MFHILVFLKVKDQKNLEYIAGCLGEISKMTLQEEPNCKRLDVYHSQADPDLFVLCEEWDQQKDWEDHRNKRAFKEIYQPKVLPLVERDPHISTLVNRPN